MQNILPLPREDQGGVARKKTTATTRNNDVDFDDQQLYQRRCQPNLVVPIPRRNVRCALLVFGLLTLLGLMDMLGCRVVVPFPKQAQACFQPQSWTTTTIPTTTIADNTNIMNLQLEKSCGASTTILVPPSWQLLELDHAFQLQVFLPGVVVVGGDGADNRNKNLHVHVDRQKRMVLLMAKVDEQASMEQHDVVDPTTTTTPTKTHSTTTTTTTTFKCFVQQWLVDESVHLPDLVMSYRDGVLMLSIPKTPEKHVAKEVTVDDSYSHNNKNYNNVMEEHGNYYPFDAAVTSPPPPPPRRIRGVFPSRYGRTSTTPPTRTPAATTTAETGSDTGAMSTTEMELPHHCRRAKYPPPPIHTIRDGGGSSRPWSPPRSSWQGPPFSKKSGVVVEPLDHDSSSNRETWEPNLMISTSPSSSSLSLGYSSTNDATTASEAAAAAAVGHVEIATVLELEGVVSSSDKRINDESDDASRQNVLFHLSHVAADQEEEYWHHKV